MVEIIVSFEELQANFPKKSRVCTYCELAVVGGSLSLGLLIGAPPALEPRDVKPARLLRPAIP